MLDALEWTGADVSVSEVEQRLARLRMEAEEGGTTQRTSVMTHIAWVPEPWLPAALEVLRGLAERHPSRTIVLVPEPDAGEAAIDAELELSRFPLGESGRSICTETVLLRLRGARAHAPASIVTPLLVSDLPVFCRWRGEPPFGLSEFEQLLGVVDRLVVDSEEWDDLPYAYTKLAQRARPHGDLRHRLAAPAAVARGARAALARDRGGDSPCTSPGRTPTRCCSRPGCARASAATTSCSSTTRRPRSSASSVDDEPVDPPDADRPTPSDLLSNELDRFGRDPIYEQALKSF